LRVAFLRVVLRRDFFAARRVLRAVFFAALRRVAFRRVAFFAVFRRVAFLRVALRAVRLVAFRRAAFFAVRFVAFRRTVFLVPFFLAAFLRALATVTLLMGYDHARSFEHRMGPRFVMLIRSIDPMTSGSQCANRIKKRGAFRQVHSIVHTYASEHKIFVFRTPA
jgi:hypothetical protein